MNRTCSRWTMLVGLLATACGDGTDDPPPAAHSETLTYWQDMVPLFEDHCLQCHRDGGIAPFRLDDYATARDLSKAIAHATQERSMPPWSMTSDGSCGEFADSLALSDTQIQRISDWVSAGAPEGTPRPLQVPDLPGLSDARVYRTPPFVPQIQGGELAEYDEYRCFQLDSEQTSTGFITGYDVLPGRPEIVHHVVLFVVDPEAPADLTEDGRTNRERLRALDDESPDRDGWPCLGAAGDGVAVKATPVIWAPGQGVVDYPNESGVPLSPTDKIIIQVHYNLADFDDLGNSDQTSVRLRIVPEVKNVGLFALPDPFLGSLFDGEPASLPARQASAIYQWTASLREIGLDFAPEAELVGIMPHMHERGRSYHMQIQPKNKPEQCGAEIQHWDFHWQRMYFYADPLTLSAEDLISVTCNYDTSDSPTPILPGWGTRNEMCLATLYFTVPRNVFEH
jgi:mono/diheme cytochrome c family protein